MTTMFQSLLESKTDCPISGIFGAGKTLSAAAMIAGSLVKDPSLKIMIITTENVAAHAFAKHFLRLGLPESINSLVGRLVGYVELQKGSASKTDLDIPPAFRNDVLRGKQVMIGCGGGFHQECSQPYSPVAPRPVVVKLRLRSPLSGNARWFTRMPTFEHFFVTSSLHLIIYMPPLFSSSFPSKPPRHEYILNGTRHSH